MGDISQSRYSIVERLTTQKLEIMEQKQKIESEIEEKKTRILQIQNDKKIKEKESKEILNSEFSIMDSDINSLNRQIASMEKGKSSKATLCDNKIKEIDIALKAIQSISAESVKEFQS